MCLPIFLFFIQFAELVKSSSESPRPHLDLMFVYRRLEVSILNTVRPLVNAELILFLWGERIHVYSPTCGFSPSTIWGRGCLPTIICFWDFYQNFIGFSCMGLSSLPPPPTHTLSFFLPLPSLCLHLSVCLSVPPFLLSLSLSLSLCLCLSLVYMCCVSIMSFL